MRPFAKLTLPAKLKRIQYWFVNYKWWWVSRQISTLLYWLRTHTYNRYHIINIKSPANGYKWGWLDRDNALFLAMFRILCDFVERELCQEMFRHTPEYVEKTKQEHGEDSFEHKVVKDNYDEQQKFIALYDWFKVEHPKLLKDDDWDELYEIETRKMKELVELRSGLWT